MRRTKKVAVKIPVTDIFLDESIYPRDHLDHNRIADCHRWGQWVDHRTTILKYGTKYFCMDILYKN